MKRVVYFFLLAVAAGCTKETYVEGLIPVSSTFSVSFVAPARQGIQTPVNFNIVGVDYPVVFKFTRIRLSGALPAYGAAVNDSLLIGYVTSGMYLGTQNAHMYKFNKGDLLPEQYSGSSTNVPLFAAVKRAPYTGGFSSVTQISGQPLYFSLADEGYISFRITNAGVPVFGWAKLIIAEQEVRVVGYGYRLHAPGKAGM